MTSVKGRVVTVLVLGAAVAAALAPAASSSPAPNTNWTSLLPALGSEGQGRAGPVRTCRRPSIRCVRRQANRMRRLRDRLGCDHRAVFATTYMTVTRILFKMLREDGELVRFPRHLYREDALFSNVYFRWVRADRRGRELPEAWRIAFETAGEGDANAVQDMLLGINAHIQNDMPFVIAAIGLTTRRGESVKPDHDALNAVLNRAYQPVVDAVRRRYDPMPETTNSEATMLDDVAGLEMIRTWRENVWRNAERLANAETRDERSEVADQIEANAAAWAEGIAAIEQPGYRDERDAYCAARL